VRTHPGISPPTLEKLLSGPGAEKGLGTKVWSLLHGIDTAEVKPARDVPTQISIEDSYRGLTDPSEIQRALVAITTSLLRRMHTDLVEEITTTTTTLNANPTPHPTPSHVNTPPPKRRWLARPKTLRLSTSPYTPFPSEATSPYPNRTSRSTPLPTFVFTTTNPNNSPSSLQETAARLVSSTLLPLFHKLHPNPIPNPDPDTGTGTGTVTGTNRDTNKCPGGWNIGVMNVCVTNMVGAGVDGGGGGRGGGGAGARDIGEMFRRQEGVLSQFRVREAGDGEGGEDGEEEEGEGGYGKGGYGAGDGDGDKSKGEGYRGNGLVEAMSPRYGRRDVSEDEKEEQQEEGESETLWDDEETPEDDLGRCPRCDRLIPGFAMSAHERYHSLEDP
jgi:DNA polymerase iota